MRLQGQKPLRQRRRHGFAFWVAVGMGLWILTIVLMEALIDFTLPSQTDSSEISTWWRRMGKRLRAPEGQDPSGHVTALEVNSVPRAGSLGVAIMQLEGKLDRLGQQVLDMERSRLNSEMRREMDAEAMKLKNKLTGEVKKLSKKRELEEEEVEGFKHRRDSELRRLAQQLAEERCRTVEECANATAAKLEKAVSGDGRTAAFATASSLQFKSENDGRRIFGPNLQNISDLRPWLPYDVSRFSYSTCAVVGNSGVLRGSGQGPSIDAHQAVLRINQAPTVGHGNDVGRKATLRLLNSVWGQAYLDHPRAAKLVASLEAGVHLVATRISPKNLARLSEKLSVARGDIGVLLLANAVVADARMALDLFRLQGQRMALMKAAAAGKSSRDSGSGGYKGGQAPSTGLLAVVLALRVCGSITVYGFSHETSRDASSSSWPYHYFSDFIDSAELRAHPHHSFKMEGDLLEHLHRQGLLKTCNKPKGCRESGDSSEGGAAGGSANQKDVHGHPRPPRDKLLGAAAKARAAMQQARAQGAEKIQHAQASAAAAWTGLKASTGSGNAAANGGTATGGGYSEAEVNPRKRKKRGHDGKGAVGDEQYDKKMAFMRSNSGRLDSDVQKAELEGANPDAAPGDSAVTWEQLSQEEQQAVSRSRYADEGLNFVLAAAEEDHAELKQVERDLKKGRQKGGKIITLKSGTRLAIPDHSSASFRAADGIEDQVPKIVDPMLLAEGETASDRRGRGGRSRRVRKSAGSAKNATDGQADVGRDVSDVDDLGGKATVAEELDGANEEELLGGASSAQGNGDVTDGAELANDQHPGNAAIGYLEGQHLQVEQLGDLKEDEAVVADGEGRNGDGNGDRGEEGWDEAGWQDEEGAEGKPDVRLKEDIDSINGPNITAHEDVSKDVGDGGGSLHSDIHKEANLGEGEGAADSPAGAGVSGSQFEVPQAAASWPSKPAADGDMPLAPMPKAKEDEQQGRQPVEGAADGGYVEAAGENASNQPLPPQGEALRKGSEATQSEANSTTAKADHPRKPLTPAQKFRRDQRIAVKLAKMSLSEIDDPNMRAREEAWRKMDKQMPTRDVDTKCLAKGSSDGCFKVWMKSNGVVGGLPEVSKPLPQGPAAAAATRLRKQKEEIQRNRMVAAS